MIKYVLALLLIPCTLYAASDRFGSERRETPRSSFTNTTDVNVFISSIPSDGIGTLVLRSIVYGGILPSTITIFDGMIFTGATSTAGIFVDIPVAQGPIRPHEVNVDIYISSALAYDKKGLAPVIFKYDWLSPRKQGDSRN